MFIKMWNCVFLITVFTFCVCLIIILNCSRESNLIANTSIQFNIITDKEIDNLDNCSNFISNSDPVLKKSSKRKIHIPKFMLDLYEERKRDDRELNFSKPDIVRSVIPKNAGTIKGKNILNNFEENHLLAFDIPSTNEEEKFFSAELRILTLIDTSKKIVTGVERFIKVSVFNDTANKLVTLDHQHVYHAKNTWIKFNVTDPVNKLVKNILGQKSLKLVISVTAFVPYLKYNFHHFKLSLEPIKEDSEHDYPILLLSYMTLKDHFHVDKAVTRFKRNIEDDYEEETNKIWDNEQQNKQVKKIRRLKNNCKKKRLYVDFAEIHYDTWIVQPSGYEAYQCTGKCFYPVADHLSPTKHAIVQALLHSIAPTRATRACCVPSKLSPISLLYIDEKGVLTYRYGYNDMVVAECGCR